MQKTFKVGRVAPDTRYSLVPENDSIDAFICADGMARLLKCYDGELMDNYYITLSMLKTKGSIPVYMSRGELHHEDGTNIGYVLDSIKYGIAREFCGDGDSFHIQVTPCSA